MSYMLPRAAGGHGFLPGDEGSAYWLGRAAVSAALRWEDDMGGSAAIHRAVRPLAPPEVGAALLAGAPEAEFIRSGGGTLALAAGNGSGNA